ncbi:hypothetical protein IJ076_00295 [Candidatus Saccharibacteria bacterium]|nr:hypothetical protein [Candidatus Saccharibacteria bacterium]
MKDFKADFKRIYQTERLMLVWMILILIAAIVLAVFSMIKLNPASSVVKVGYGDIGGYRDGSWTEFIAFPLVAILLGVLHNFIAVRIFHKRGAGMAKFFLITTSVLIAGAFIVLVRLVSQEG